MKSRSGTASVRSMATRSRAGTAATGRQAAFLPHRDIKIAAHQRPVTAAAGVASAHSHAHNTPNGSSSGRIRVPSRQVQDASYFIALLNSKKNQIEQEMFKIQSKVSDMEGRCVGIETRKLAFDSLLEEVRRLEEIMADMNLAHAKQRNGADPEDVGLIAMDLMNKNEEAANRVDQLFMRNQQRLSAVRDVELDIANTHERFQRLLEHDPVTGAEYHRMTEELKCLKEEGTDTEAEILNLRHRMGELQAQILQRRDYHIRETYDSEMEQVSSLKTSIKKIEEDLRVAQMGEDEARVYLLDKVKSDKKSIMDLDKEAKRIDKDMLRIDSEESQIMKQIHIKEEHEHSKASLHEEMKDPAQIYWRCEDARQYLISSKEKCELESLERSKTEKQEIINSLSKEVRVEEDNTEMQMPTKEKFEHLSHSTAFKAKHLEHSKQTMSHLLAQKSQRKKELEKIAGLEQKISEEFDRITTATAKIDNDVKIYEDLDLLDERAESTREYLIEMKERFTERAAFMEAEAKKLSSHYDKNRRLLESNKTWNSLKDFEDKLSRQSQGVYILKDFVRRKGRQTDYESIKINCMAIANELNDFLLTSQ